MGFKRARSEEQFKQREQEIIDSAMAIYQEFGFEEVNFSKISERTKFTRPTIYSYFKTKEEIMLRLTAVYLKNFASSLNSKLTKGENTDEGIAEILADSFIEEPEFIHLYTVLFSIIEKNVSVAALAQFKKDVVMQQYNLATTFKSIYRQSSDEEINSFIMFSFCYAGGLCPMTEENEVQKEAITLSKTGYKTPDFKVEFVKTVLIYLKTLNR